MAPDWLDQGKVDCVTRTYLGTQSSSPWVPPDGCYALSTSPNDCRIEKCQLQVAHPSPGCCRGGRTQLLGTPSCARVTIGGAPRVDGKVAAWRCGCHEEHGMGWEDSVEMLRNIVAFLPSAS